MAKVLVTAALPYINNVPHMGHIVGSHLPADIFHRYLISSGRDAVFVGGSDEHGTPSVVAAKELGVSPQVLVDRLYDVHRAVYERLDIGYDIFSRTSSEGHHQTVRDFFEGIEGNGFISQGSVDMPYCERDDMFLPDRFIEGECPKCGYEDANGDQCENCSTILNSVDLVNPHCKICGDSPEVRTSEHLYLDLPRLGERLDSWIEENEANWRNHVHGAARQWLDDGLQSRSITRDMDWGVHVPGQEGKVFYVWFDAPIGYYSFTRELGEDVAREVWEEDGEIYHFLGKDNVPFHTVFWPGMLLAHEGLNLPTRVVGYNYLNFDGRKFSKSQGVGVFCFNLLDSDIEIDTLRSYLTTVIPENKDSSFRWDDFRSHVNNELIATMGNLFNRTLRMIFNNFDGELDYSGLEGLTEADRELVDAIERMPGEIGDSLENTEIRAAYRKVMEFASMGNAYLNKTMPWTTVKTDKEEARRSLYLTLNLCRSLAIVSAPILPGSMQTLWSEQMGFDGSVLEKGRWSEADKVIIPKNHRLKGQSIIYKKVDETRLDELEKHFQRPHSLESLVI